MDQYYAIQQSGVTSYEEMRNSVSVSLSDGRGPMVCPKPRRVGLLNGTVNESSRPLRWHFCSHQSEMSDSKAVSELLDIIFSKGSSHGTAAAPERPSTTTSNTQVIASSPPFFCGSPPSRVSNPLIQDARFKEEAIMFPPASASPVSGPVSVSGVNISPSGQSPSPSARKSGGCVRANFGNNPAVRVEGFDCLDRDRSRNCSIPALA